MDRCGQYRDQLLDYLYDLLEPEVQQSLSEHLNTCALCQSGLAQARQQQHLLASAARLSFPHFRFAAPQPNQAGRERLIQLPNWRWGRWAAAAAILLLVGGASIPVVGVLQRHRQLESSVETAKARHDQAIESEAAVAREFAADLQKRRTEQARLTEQVAVLLPREHRELLESFDREEKEHDLVVHLSGSDVIQPGSHFDIDTLDHRGRPVPADLKVRLIDVARNAVVAEPQVAERRAGTYVAVVPPGMKLAPDMNLRVEVVAHRAEGATVPVTAAVHTPSRSTYRTHLITDRPVYHPGETVRFRSLTLERDSFAPPDGELQLRYSVSRQGANAAILNIAGSSTASDSQGTILRGPGGKPLRGLGAGEFVLDGRFPEGEYVLTVREATNSFPAEQRVFRVRADQDLFLKGAEFNQPSYSAGSDVVANAWAVRVEGTALTDREAIATLTIDGKTYDAQGKTVANGQPLGKLRTDAEGKVKIAFRLPERVDDGDAQLAIEFIDGNNRESLIRRFPVNVLKRVVAFYPEGGTLAAGVTNRVYFDARTPLGEPAALRGHLVDDQGKVILEVATFHDPEHPRVEQGAGVFAFTPLAGRTYHLRTENGKFDLPRADFNAVALSVPGGVVNPEQPVRVVLRSARTNRSLWVTASCRGQLLDHQHVVLQGQEAAVDLNLAPSSLGVARITVYEERHAAGKPLELVPVAERLIHRPSPKRMKLAVTPQKLEGQKVGVGIRASDESGQPVDAIVLLHVVDTRSAGGKLDGALPAHFLVSHEIRNADEMEEAEFLLGDSAKAREALDLFLGTRGWRRFVELEGEPRQPENVRQDAQRFLVLDALSVEDRKIVNQVEQKRRDEETHFQQEQRKLTTALAAEIREVENQKLRDDRELVRLNQNVDETRDEYRSALVAFQDYDDWFQQLRRILQPALAVVLGLLATLFLVVAVARRVPRPVWYYGASATCALLLAVVALRSGLGNTFLSVDSVRTDDETQFAALKNELSDAAQPRGPVPGIRPVPMMAMRVTPPANLLRPAVEVAQVEPGVQRVESKQPARFRPEAPSLALEDAKLLAAAHRAPPKVMVAPPAPQIMIREYAYQRSLGNSPATLYWHPARVLPSGRLESLTFDLPELTGPIQIRVLAHTVDGRLGAALVDWPGR